MNKDQLAFKLESLIIYHNAEHDGDEIFLKHEGAKIWPPDNKFRHIKGASIEVNLTIALGKINNWLEVELWDYNYFLPSSCLGIFKIFPDRKGGPFTSELIRANGIYARYTMLWRVE